MFVVQFITILYFIITLHNIYSYCSENGSVCTTPNGERAICKSVHECPIILNSLSSKDGKQMEFIKQSQCGYDKKPLVCCGTVDHYTSIFTILNRKDCGFQEADSSLGETTADKDEFPWMAILQYKYSNGTLQDLCVGTLISNQYVLTSAYCTTFRFVSLVSVRLGERNIKRNSDCLSIGKQKSCSLAPDDIDIESVITHGQYGPGQGLQYDIALIKLSRPVNISTYVRPICLPPTTETYTNGEQLILAGWGKTEQSGETRNVKLKVTLPIFNRTQCTSEYRSELGEFCVGMEGSKGLCTAYSGGPLMKMDNSQWYIAGIGSTEKICGGFTPAYYTQVSLYLNWIYDNLKH